MVARFGFDPLHWVGLARMAAAIALRLWAGRRLAGRPQGAVPGSAHG
jgi:hypothetical protein